MTLAAQAPAGPQAAHERILPLTAEAEKRLLQAAVALASLVPLAAGAASLVAGAAMIAGVGSPVPIDLDSHFRYLSGLLFAIGLAYLWCIPAIERKTRIVRLLGFIVVAGGLFRLFSLIEDGAPGPGHVFGLVMELAVVPAITLWQGRLARRFADL